MNGRNTSGGIIFARFIEGLSTVLNRGEKAQRLLSKMIKRLGRGRGNRVTDPGISQKVIPSERQNR
jgi:hypothetical protein